MANNKLADNKLAESAANFGYKKNIKNKTSISGFGSQDTERYRIYITRTGSRRNGIQFQDLEPSPYFWISILGFIISIF